jgi:manganese/zinc/iron transport system permease protein
MPFSVWEFFTDPVLRAPTLGSMLMCLASSLAGVLVFIRKRSLLGEVLSHASYPGIVFGVMAAAVLFPQSDEAVSFSILAGAFIFALLGLAAVEALQRKTSIHPDAALCFVLSAFFGVGVLFASDMQTSHPVWYKQIQLFLYGQAATMRDVHIVLYGALALFVICSIALLYRPIQTVNFDRDFARSIGLPVSLIESCLFVLLVLAIVIGIRSVGVVLMSGMLIAPAVAARQYSHSLGMVFIISGIWGVLSGFLGNYFSIIIPHWLGRNDLSLPTGPMILLTASAICFLSLLAAPQRGMLRRVWRICRFRYDCLLENLLKALHKQGEGREVRIADLSLYRYANTLVLRILLHRLRKQGWIEKSSSNCYKLTLDGWKKASRIIRLHRLWEVYLVDYLGQKSEKVHRNAEEMEHVITPDLEKELTELLGNPRQDPHQQPIPTTETLL